MGRKEIMDSYYNNYSESDRFTKDNYHSLEYTISKHWFDKYLKHGDRILEVGAGTGDIQFIMQIKVTESMP